MVIWGEKGGMVFNTSFNNISVILWQSSGISDQQQKLKRVYPNIICGWIGLYVWMGFWKEAVFNGLGFQIGKSGRGLFYHHLCMNFILIYPTISGGKVLHLFPRDLSETKLWYWSSFMFDPTSNHLMNDNLIF
jgi:hypothetical protein